jgi:hypothetical protein
MSVNATATGLINIETFGTFLKVVQGLKIDAFELLRSIPSYAFLN